MIILASCRGGGEEEWGGGECWAFNVNSHSRRQPGTHMGRFNIHV